MGDECVLKIRVVPNSKRDGVVGLMDDGETLKLRVSAPAVDGKANVALVKLLAASLPLKRGAIEILGGEKSRSKVVRLVGVRRGAVLRRLGASV